MNKKTIKAPPPNKESLDKVGKACELIAETISINNIEENIAISAMASIIVGTLSQITESRHFYSVMSSMNQAFHTAKKLQGITNEI